MNLEKLFNPKSIAIVGASDEKGKVGALITDNILNLGYEGKVFFVNPKHPELNFRKCYKELSEIEDELDLAIIAIPAKFVIDVVRSAADKVKNYVIISAGFSETGKEGVEREMELKQIAEENDLNIIGPNCLGFIIPKIKLNASFGEGMPKTGDISFISQSGALISAFMDIFAKENIGFSNVISVGNKMDIDESDLFEYLETDKETKVIGMYLEGIKNGKKFREKAEKLSKAKPIVILKAGKTDKAQKAISSHTGALAGSEEIIRALFKKTGIIEAENLSEFLNLLKLISATSAPLNEKMAIITNAGGAGVLTTDAFSKKEIQIADIDEKTKDELREFLPKESSVENPIDLLGDAQEDRYEKALETINKVEFGSIISILTPQKNTPVEKVANKIIEFKNKTGKNIIAIFIGGEKTKKSIEKLEESGIPSFSFPEEAVGALNKYFRWAAGKNRIEIKRHSEAKDLERAKNIIKKAQSEGRKALFFGEAKEVMDIYGINTIDFQEVNPESALEIDFPLVMKIDSDKVLHKTDKQGVIVNIKNEDELREAYQKMTENFPGEKIIIQPMQEIKTELILGIKKDETVGPVVVFGLGGIYTEIFKMVDFLIPPCNLEEIRETLLQSPINFLFRENRGQKEYDLEDLAQTLLNLVRLAEDLDLIKELDINPMLVYNDGKKGLAVDVKIIF